MFLKFDKAGSHTWTKISPNTDKQELSKLLHISDVAAKVLN